MTSDALARTPVAEARIAQAQFARWDAALASGDPEQVSALYASDAVLLPTLSSRVRGNHAERVDYFTEFLAGGPRGRILSDTVRAVDDVVIHSGLYRFAMSALDGQPEIDARFTFVHQRISGDWTIVAHHSSLMPTP